MRNNIRDEQDRELELDARANAELICGQWEVGERNAAAARFQACAHRELVAALVTEYMITYFEMPQQDLIDGIRFLSEHRVTETN